MAVGVSIGGTFGKIVSSLVNGIVMLLVSLATGGAKDLVNLSENERCCRCRSPQVRYFLPNGAGTPLSVMTPREAIMRGQPTRFAGIRSMAWAIDVLLRYIAECEVVEIGSTRWQSRGVVFFFTRTVLSSVIFTSTSRVSPY